MDRVFSPRLWWYAVTGMALAMAGGGALPAFGQGTAFTYQGRLASGGSPASGSFDFQFSLWDAGSAGVQQGPLLTFDGVGADPAPITVTNGLLTATLDFGNQFPGADRFLQIGVRPHSVGLYTPLSPRQPLTPAPYAIFSGNAGLLNGLTSSAFLQAVPNPLNLVNSVDGASVISGINNSTAGGSIGVLGEVSSTNPGGFSTGVSGINNGTGGLGIGVLGSHNGSGWGVYGTSVGGVGVYGNAFGNSGTNYGVYGQTASSSGYAGYFQGQGLFSGNLTLNRTLTFTDPASGITFPATAGSNAPMIQMFASGTSNADRMVIAHSPPFTNWGLQYQDSIDVFRFLSGGTQVMAIGLGAQTVSVGTSSPGGKLGVTTPSGVGVWAESGGSGLSSVALRANNTNASGIGIWSTTGSSDTNVVLTNTGSGDLIRGFSGGSGGNLVFQVLNNGDTTVHILTQTSSRRYKQNIKPMDHALDKVSRLQAVRFDWDAAHGGGHDIGFIAEDVGKVVPEIVSYEKDGRNAVGIKCDRIGALTVEAIKEQQKQILSLSAENAELKTQLAALAADIKELKATVRVGGK